MLRPTDILSGAVTPGSSNAFVIGAYDTRITFYSQQVRALELVHALHEQGRLKSGPRCAVIGGGAAGVTAAAALALVSDATVDLYESNPDILALQSASTRRRLDPHIYDWPTTNASDPVAGLPILDWKTAAAGSVRQDVKLEFEMLAATLDPRISVRTGHSVRGVTPNARVLDVAFDRDRTLADAAFNAAGRVEATESYDLVIFAFGFGLEPPVGAGIAMPSYWRDGGVPGPEIQGNPRPRFLVSGNGDGGLIDLVAAASANFDHQGMIDQIIHQPGINDVGPELLEIDREARAAGDAGYDFFSAYTTRILPALQAMGLPARMAARLRGGVQLTLQTLDAQPFSVGSAILNRLAAFLVIKACESNPVTTFTHVHGPTLTQVEPPHARPYAAVHWFECAGQILGVDTAIIRHGTGREAVREPFANVLLDYRSRHAEWRARYGEDILVPKLSHSARELFLKASRDHHIPAAQWVAREAEAHQPLRVGVQVGPGGLVWSGDIAAAEADQVWNGDGGRSVELYSPPFPDELGAAASAVFRLVLHAPRAMLYANVGAWQAYAVTRSSDSPHARQLTPPNLIAGDPAGVSHNPQSLAADVLASVVHRALDAWMLRALDERISAYVDSGHDPGSVITLRAAADLRARMGQVWAEWRIQFQANADLLSRFLRLMLCARDDEEAREQAQILIGPKKLDSIVRAVAVSLAVAAGWTTLGPVAEPPGNLTLVRNTGGAWAGHACGADMIDREPTQIVAGRFMWRTNFVVLPMIDASIEALLGSTVALADVGSDQPRLSEAAHATSIMLTTDQAFRTAAQAGLEAMAHYLALTETNYYSRLRLDIQEVPA